MFLPSKLIVDKNQQLLRQLTPICKQCVFFNKSVLGFLDYTWAAKVVRSLD